MGLAVLLNTERGKIVSAQKVLSEAEYGAVLDATALVNEAARQALKIAQAAQQEADRCASQGYEDGLRRAQQEYCARSLAKVDDAVAELAHLRGVTARIVVTAVREMLQSADQAQLYLTALEKVSTLSQEQTLMTMVVAPACEAQARAALDQWNARRAGGQPILLQTDPAMADDGCRIVTAVGSVEVGIDQQLAALRAAIDPSQLRDAAQDQTD